MSNNIHLSIITTSRGRADMLEKNWELFLSSAKYPNNTELSLCL